ncbi:MAG TPA: hypothetical protein VLB67_05930 [Acidimicrobiia bacterium]|nr:hypothetical protein [Acidimicrobiia bacterium]
MTEPSLAIAVSARDWPDRLRQALADHGGARVRLTALSAYDLDEDHHDVLVIDDVCSFFSRGLVTREHSSGRSVVGVYDRAEPEGKARLQALGVDAIVSCDEPAEVFVAAARRVARRPGPSTVREAALPQPGETVSRSTLVSVRSVSGGVGASEIALALAHALHDACLVELATLPSLAQRVGLQLHPNLATAVEIAEHGHGDVTGALQPVAARVRALVGFPDQSQAGRSAVRRVLSRLEEAADWIVADAGTEIPAPIGTGHEILVAAASPVGVSRCIDLVRRHDLLDVHLVLNRAARTGFQRSQLHRVVLEQVKPRSLTIVPDDPLVAHAAWNGRPVRGGPFTKAIDSLALAVRTAA